MSEDKTRACKNFSAQTQLDDPVGNNTSLGSIGIFRG